MLACRTQPAYSLNHRLWPHQVCLLLQFNNLVWSWYEQHHNFRWHQAFLLPLQCSLPLHSHEFLWPRPKAHDTCCMGHHPDVKFLMFIKWVLNHEAEGGGVAGQR